MKKLSVGIVLLLTLAACTDDSPGSEPSTSTPAPSVAATPTPSEAPYAPNVGSTALDVGQWREGEAARTVVTKVTQARDARKPSFLAGDTTGDGALIQAKACTREDAVEGVWASYFNFVGYDSDGGQYTASGSSWGDWPPVPQYPGELLVQPGRCVKGSILLEVPQGVSLVRIAGVDSGETFAEWEIP